VLSADFEAAVRLFSLRIHTESEERASTGHAGRLTGREEVDSADEVGGWGLRDQPSDSDHRDGVVNSDAHPREQHADGSFSQPVL
jgi:hypothetical protein